MVGMSGTNTSSSNQEQGTTPVQYNSSPLTGASGYSQPPAYQTYGNYPGIQLFFLKRQHTLFELNTDFSIFMA